MKIKYSGHAKLRINSRNIPYQAPRRIVQTSKERYFDHRTGHIVAVGVILYEKNPETVVVVYDIISERIDVITIQQFARNAINARIKNGRWAKI